MDFLFLPKLADPEKRAGAFAFKSYSVKVTKRDSFRHSGFYYVGKKHASIERLVDVYGRGYASEGLDNVKAELLRTLELEENVIPEVILCEARFGHHALGEFAGFLRRHPVLNAVPIILDGCGLSEDELKQFKTYMRPDEILFLDKCDAGMLKKKISFLRRCKATIKTMSEMPELINGEGHSRLRMVGHFLKRCFDVLVASLILLLVSPLLILIALAVKLESRGPVFYIAKRAGKGYKIFDFYKFRTMEKGADQKIGELNHLNQYNAETAGPVFFKINNDPRITRVGRFLRNTSLDELPQLFNVFLGDMSLVGNRPLPLYEAETLTTDDYAMRFMAPAGITGLWQIKKRGNKDMSVEERINIDIHYAQKYNFVTDLWIMANTPSALLQKENV